MQQLSPWLVRLLCDNCGEEHYRYFDTSRSTQLVLVQGQCRCCFDEIQAGLIAFNMIQQPVGQRAWVNSFHGNSDNNTYTAAPNWYYTAITRINNLRDVMKLVKEIRLKQQK